MQGAGRGVEDAGAGCQNTSNWLSLQARVIRSVEKTNAEEPGTAEGSLPQLVHPLPWSGSPAVLENILRQLQAKSPKEPVHRQSLAPPK